MRTVICALIIAPLWISPALAQETRKSSRTSPAAERNPAIETLERRVADLERTFRPDGPALKVEQMELSDRVSALAGRVSALEQLDVASRLQALETETEELSDQLSSLLDVIQVTGGGVEIGTAGKLSLQGSSLRVDAAKATVNAALVELSGILTAVNVQAQSVVAETITPAAGNVW